MVRNIAFFIQNSVVPPTAANAAERCYVEADELSEAKKVAEAIKARLNWSGDIRETRSGKGVILYRQPHEGATQVLKLLGLEVEQL